MKFLILAITLVLYRSVTGLTESDLNHECLRTCEWPPQPRTCSYNFTVEWFYSMSKACYDCPFNITDCYRPDCIPLNGVPRPVAVVNRMFPGPSIQVCENDTIEVHVTNKMQHAEGISIHWHGPHQRGTPYMDGTAMVTQCPIPSYSTFTYNFQAAPYGTHWWHSHAGMQRADGVFGALVFRQSTKADVNSAEYDYDLPEHVVIVHDWLDQMTMAKFAAHHYDNGNNRPESILINGKGKREEFTDGDGNKTYTEREVFTISAGSRYRFRMINNAITNCALRISVDSHKLTIIASDGGSLQPYETDMFVIFGGERFDFVLSGNQTVGNYWMRVKGLADCRLVEELAIVRYDGAAEEDPTEDEVSLPIEGVVVNPWNEDASDLAIPIVQLKSAEPDDETSKETADVTYYIGMDFNKVNNYHFHQPEYYPIEEIARSHHLYSPQLNHRSFKFASSPPLTQSSEVNTTEFCTPESIANDPKDCVNEYCECTHTVNAALGQVVEFVVVDEGVTFDASHPMHIHGQSFRVVALEKLGRSTSVQEVMEMDKAGNITRTLHGTVRKDTVIIPDGGFTAFRFLADNPGWWFFHCHLEFHVEIGMALLIHVGSDEDLPPKPANFPRCGNWPSDFSQAPCETNAAPSSFRHLQAATIITSLICLWKMISDD